jgi:type I restriction enzyme S subunit
MTFGSPIPFSDAVVDATGGNAKVQRKDYLRVGLLPVIDQGQEEVAGYTDDAEAAYQGPLPVVLFGDHTRAFKYVDAPFALGADGVKVLEPKSGFDAKFLFYFFRSCDIPSRGYSRHFKYLREISVPYFAPSEQARIVELLDQAEALRRLRREADVKAARILPALFLKMFGDPASNPMGWPTDRLGNLFDVFGGGTPSKSVSEYWRGDIPWVSPKDMKVDVINDTEDHISLDAVKNSATKLVERGSVLIVYRSGILAHTFPVAIAGRELTLNQDLKALSSLGEVSNDFIYGWLVAGQKLALSCVKTGATVHNIDGPRFLSLQVPKPPKHLQVRFSRHLQTLLSFKQEREAAAQRVDELFALMMQRAFSGQLTAKWRQAHMQELLAEMQQQAKAVNLHMPKEVN